MGINLNDLRVRLAHARKNMGFTQEELAERMDVSVSTIAKIECGLRYPSLEMIMAFSKNLNVTLDYLTFGMSVEEYKFLELMEEMDEKLDGLDESQIRSLHEKNIVQPFVQSVEMIEESIPGNPRLLSAMHNVLNKLTGPAEENKRL